MTIETAIRGARAAGFQGDDLVTIGCIGGRESGWNTAATHNSARPDLPNYVPLTDAQLHLGWVEEYSVGTWQLNLWSRSATGQLYPVHTLSEADARDDDIAARYCRRLWQQSGFQSWSTYTANDGQFPPSEVQQVRDEIARQEGGNVPDSTTTVTVVPGDTLWALAVRYLGDGNRWHDINVWSGRDRDNQDIQPGDVLTVAEPTPAPTPGPDPEHDDPQPMPGPDTRAQQAVKIRESLAAAGAELQTATQAQQLALTHVANAVANATQWMAEGS